MARRTAKRAAQPLRAAPHQRRSTPRAGASRRAQRSVERRDAILAAALEEFAASGFAATRLDDVAKRAGVAKGTIYLYFADKETLFEELISSQLSPVISTLERAAQTDIPLQAVVEQFVEVFTREIFGTRRKDVIRLVIAEGPRFPKLAEFYYREVLSRVMGAIRAVLRRAMERGELENDALVRFPQLLAAPGIVAIIWNGLFDRFEPLDVRALLRAHFDLVLGRRAV